MTPRFRLGGREAAALLFLWQSRFVQPGQLRRALWRDRPREAFQARWAALREAGLLAWRRGNGLPRGGLCLPTRAGNRVLVDCGLLEPGRAADVPRAPERPGPSLRHDLDVVDLRLALERSGADASSWVSDHELRSRRRAAAFPERTPDGLFEFELRGARAGGVLEYERSPYHRRRLPALLARLRERHPRRVVFLVAASASRALTLLRWAGSAGVYRDAPLQLAFSHRAAVVRKGLAAAFLDAEGGPWAVASGGERGGDSGPCFRTFQNETL